MSEQNTNITRTFEDTIREKLTEQMQQNALDYVAFLKANGIQGDGVYTVPGAYLCNIHRVDDTGWGISMEEIDSVLCRSEYQDWPVEQAVKEFAWAHVSNCGNHGCGFNPGRRIILFGKEFHHNCFALMGFDSPGGEDLENLKKLTLVWKQCVDDAAKKGTLWYGPEKSEWPISRHTDANAGRPLGKVFTKTLNVEFTITMKKKWTNYAAVGFSGGELIPADIKQHPVALGIGARRYDLFQAIKGAEGYAHIDTLKYQQNVSYLVEMNINIADNLYNATVWMLDADGQPDTPYYIAKKFPFRLEEGVQPLTCIDTIYPVYVHGDSYIINDFRIVSGK